MGFRKALTTKSTLWWFLFTTYISKLFLHKSSGLYTRTFFILRYVERNKLWEFSDTFLYYIYLLIGKFRKREDAARRYIVGPLGSFDSTQLGDKINHDIRTGTSSTRRLLLPYSSFQKLGSKMGKSILWEIRERCTETFILYFFLFVISGHDACTEVFFAYLSQLHLGL